MGSVVSQIRKPIEVEQRTINNQAQDSIGADAAQQEADAGREAQAQMQTRTEAKVQELSRAPTPIEEEIEVPTHIRIPRKPEDEILLEELTKLTDQNSKLIKQKDQIAYESKCQKERLYNLKNCVRNGTALRYIDQLIITLKNDIEKEKKKLAAIQFQKNDLNKDINVASQKKNAYFENQKQASKSEVKNKLNSSPATFLTKHCSDTKEEEEIQTHIRLNKPPKKEPFPVQQYKNLQAQWSSLVMYEKKTIQQLNEKEKELERLQNCYEKKTISTYIEKLKSDCEIRISTLDKDLKTITTQIKYLNTYIEDLQAKYDNAKLLKLKDQIIEKIKKQETELETKLRDCYENKTSDEYVKTSTNGVRNIANMYKELGRLDAQILQIKYLGMKISKKEKKVNACLENPKQISQTSKPELTKNSHNSSESSPNKLEQLKKELADILDRIGKEQNKEKEDSRIRYYAKNCVKEQYSAIEKPLNHAYYKLHPNNEQRSKLYLDKYTLDDQVFNLEQQIEHSKNAEQKTEYQKQLQKVKDKIIENQEQLKMNFEAADFLRKSCDTLAKKLEIKLHIKTNLLDFFDYEEKVQRLQIAKMMEKSINIETLIKDLERTA